MIKSKIGDFRRHPWGIIRNWVDGVLARRKIESWMAKFGSPRKIVVVDVGASGGVPPLWRWFIEKYAVRVFQFDLSDEWYPEQGLEDNVTRFKFALGDKVVHGAAVYITRHPGCTSLLKPNEEVLRRFEIKEWCRVVRTGVIDLTTYEAIADRENLEAPTFLKVDVQGFEHKVIQGMGRYLDSVVACELEVHMEPMYEGESPFDNINLYLKERGFLLVDLQAQGPFGGEAFEFNAFWVNQDALDNPGVRPLIDAWRVLNGLYMPIPFSDANFSAEQSHGFNK